MSDKTMSFSLGNDEDIQVRMILNQVYEALKEKGYNPINQIVGYILSGDPTYITAHKKARTMICKIDSHVILRAIIKYYLTD